MHNRPGPTDTVPAWLSPGEAVLNKEAAEMMGRDRIKALNHKGLKMRHARKGIVPVQGFEDGTKNVQPAQGSFDSKANNPTSTRSTDTTSSLPKGVQKVGTSYSAAKPEGTGSISADPRYQEGAQITRLDGSVGTGGPGYTDSITPDTSAPKSNLQPYNAETYYQDRASDLGLLSKDANAGNFANQSTGITTLGGGANAQSLANKGSGALGVGGIMRSLGVGQATTSPLVNIGQDVEPLVMSSNQQQDTRSLLKNLTQGLGGSVVDWGGAPGFQSGIEEVGKDIYPTKSATPAQQAIEKITGVSGKTAGKAIPMSAAEAQKQTAAKAPTTYEFLGKQNEKGIFKKRPVKPGTALVPVEGTYKSAPPPKASFGFKPGEGTTGAGAPKPGGFTLGKGPAGEAFRSAEAAKNAPKIDPYTGEAIRSESLGQTMKSAAGKAAATGKGILGKAYSVGKSIALAPENIALAAEEWNKARTEKLLTEPDRGAAQNVELAARAPVYAATRFNPYQAYKAYQQAQEQKANTPLPEGAPLTGGATVGGKEPEIDFSNPSISDIVGEKADVNSPRGEAKAVEPKVSEQWEADQARLQAEKEQAPQRAAEMAAAEEKRRQPGIEGGVSSFWKNMGYSGGAAQKRAEDQMKQLQQIALYGGGTGDMSVSEYANANRRQKAAVAALSDMQKAATEREGQATKLGEARAARDEARAWKESEIGRHEKERAEDIKRGEEQRKDQRAWEESKLKSQEAAKEKAAAEKWYKTDTGYVQGRDIPEMERKRLESEIRNTVSGYIDKNGDSLDNYVKAIVSANAPEADDLMELNRYLTDSGIKMSDDQRKRAMAKINALVSPYRGL